MQTGHAGDGDHGRRKGTEGYTLQKGIVLQGKSEFCSRPAAKSTGRG